MFYSFDAKSLQATPLGILGCPVANSPFTMTMSADGAYILYQDGNLYRVSLPDLHCVLTNFEQGQLGFPSDIGIATDEQVDGAMSFLAYGCVRGSNGCAPTLARSDFTSFKLAEIGPVTPDPNVGYPLDVKVDALGRLFAFDVAGAVVAINASTAATLGKDETGLVGTPAYAVLTWNDEIFLFTGPQGTISKHDLLTKQTPVLGMVGEPIAGAGAVPCRQ